VQRLTLLVTAILALAFVSPASASKKLFVGNLPWGTTSERLERNLARFGPILSLVVTSTDRDGEMSAEAVAEYENDEDADRAEATLDGLVVAGEPISAKAREIVVVGSKVKDVVREAGLRSDGELVQAVSDKVHEILEGAIARTRSNGRSTVRPYDL